MRALTPAYASPQVLAGAAPTVRDDVFSFGCIAYELLTGRHPFQQHASNVAQEKGLTPDISSDIDPEQARALNTALAWDIESRPDNIKDLARALAPPTARRRTSFVVEPEEELSRPEPQDDRHWWVLGGVCLAAMIAAVLVTRFT